MEEQFKSLNHLRNGIRYLLEAIAALSGLLLTLGLVSASWNFLDKDGLFGNAPWLQSIWGLDQALAIDANLPLVFVFLFFAVKQRDWVKTAIYTVIGIMLLFVAAIILDMESLRQALDISLDAAAIQVHISMGLLTQVRSAATIGLVAMSGLTWTPLLVKASESFKQEPQSQPVETEEVAPSQPVPEPETQIQEPEVKAKPASADTYQKYLELVASTPKEIATIPWLVEQLGVSPSTISNYRRKSRTKDTKSNDEVFQPTPALTEEALATATA